MLQFQGRNINSEFDLLRVRVQTIDFIKSLKLFDKTDLERLSDLVYELTKELVFNRIDAHICLNHYKQERKKGLEVYVYNKNMSIEKAQEALNNNYNLSKKGISLDKNAGFLDNFDLKQDLKSGIEIRILKWAK